MNDTVYAVEGTAFPLTVKWLASVFVAALVLQGTRVGVPLLEAGWTDSAAAVFVLAGLSVGWCLWWIWRSRTAVDAAGIRQSWIWTKRAAWGDIAQARLLAVPGLEWLVAPRLIVRMRVGGVVAFHCADPKVLQALALFAATGVPPRAAAAPASGT
ncbi:hypothetical protein FN976_27345 [Caenimonas sedimenti]|uniref:PH domain-containing protein n=1 Tax=Caenimonas sedimenti TaxID=2596921 RepID=A0A562ZEF3_9BURK|nr:hypothetical protein [Caenimonas sedimenti]TWO65525.1 hypothetical protein FN976_27345 [Caenimonas sedimenti]